MIDVHAHNHAQFLLQSYAMSESSCQTAPSLLRTPTTLLEQGGHSISNRQLFHTAFGVLGVAASCFLAFRNCVWELPDGVQAS